VGPWLGHILTHPDAINHMTAQLLAAMAVVARFRSEYRRSIHWADLARRRYAAETQRLGLANQIDRCLYPLNYFHLISQAASRHGVDPLLVASVIREESHFDAQAVSPAGARGLMQIMPKTGAWIASQLKWAGFSEDVLANPSDSIEFGAYYLSHLMGILGRSPGALPWVLAAYNGGIGNVKRWMDLRENAAGEPNIDAIEFKETRDYIMKVRGTYEAYRRLYRPGASGAAADGAADADDEGPGPEAAGAASPAHAASAATGRGPGPGPAPGAAPRRGRSRKRGRSVPEAARRPGGGGAASTRSGRR
jgi:soluble lytic murein transglycosylase